MVDRSNRPTRRQFLWPAGLEVEGRPCLRQFVLYDLFIKVIFSSGMHGQVESGEEVRYMLYVIRARAFAHCWGAFSLENKENMVKI